MAGYSNGIRAVHVAVVLHRGPGEQVTGVASNEGKVCRIQGARRDRPEIDHLHAFFFGQIHQHEAHTAQPAVPGLYGCECQPGGDGGINGVAARLEDFDTRFTGDAVLCGDDAATRARDGLAHVPVLNEVFHFCVRCNVLGVEHEVR